MTKHTFQRSILLIIILGLIYYTLGDGNMGTWGLNKTVGWAWDLRPIGWLIFSGTILAFLIFLLISIILNLKLNRFLLITQIVLIISPLVFYKIIDDCVILLIHLFSPIVLIVGVVWAIREKRKFIDN